MVQWHLHVSVFLSFVLQKHMSEFFLPIAGTPKTLLELLSLEDEVSKDEWLSMYDGAAHSI